jgi:cytoskeletal protein CcmA (bactofilin family)
MWKKEETPQPETIAPLAAVTPRPHLSGEGAKATRARATIGSSITIRGEVTGDEDLLIEGRVDGSVDLKQHSVTVGADGQVKAGVSGRVVTVEGSVQGNLKGVEVVILKSTARVQGDITAPRVVLEDGAAFRGGVDMGDPAGGVSPPRSGGAPAPQTRDDEPKERSVPAGAPAKGTTARPTGVTP